jgi:hypothetical protein
MKYFALKSIFEDHNMEQWILMHSEWQEIFLLVDRYLYIIDRC